MLPIYQLRHRTWTVDFLGLLFICGLFYFFWLGHYPLFIPDEGRYSEVAREMVASGDYITPRVDGVVFLDKPILYYWLQATSIRLFGLHEWALRLFPSLFGLFGILVTYFCGRHLFDRRTGLLAAVILATTPLYFGSAHYANLDLEVAVCISSALLFLITGLQKEGRPRFYFLMAAYVASALGFLTKGMMSIAFPGMILFAWMALLNRWATLKHIYLFLGILLIAAISLPWYILVSRANPEFFHYFFVTQQVSRFLSAGVFNNSSPFWFYVPVILLGFFPWTVFLIQTLVMNVRQVIQNRAQHAVELFLLLWVGCIFVFFSIPHAKIISYILPLIPALALLVGRYVSLLWTTAQQKAIDNGLNSFIIASLLLAFLLFVLPRYHWIDFSRHFIPYLAGLTTILIISPIIAFFFARKERMSRLFMICASCSVIFLITIILGATHLNQNTTKPLVEELKVIIQPQDEVVTYFKYFHDVPFYLDRKVTIVTDWDSPQIINKDNWVRELWYGKTYQKENEHLIDEAQFWKRWNSDKRLFVFLNINYFEQFKSKATSYFVLCKHNDVLLISNKPTVLAAIKERVTL